MPARRSMPIPDPGQFIRNEDVPVHPLRVKLQTNVVPVRDDIHAIIVKRCGVVKEIVATSRSHGKVAWQIAFHPPSLIAAVEIMVGLLDIGQLSFALPPNGKPSS